jgi:hypothetical protein
LQLQPAVRVRYGVKELAIPTQGWCDFHTLFRIRQGNCAGVDLGGTALAFAGDFPGNPFDGKATARLYIDEHANADQRRELEAIFQGRKGGPMALLAPLYSNWLPTQVVKIDVQEQGGTLSATVGGFGLIKSKLLTNAAGQPTTTQNTAFATFNKFDNQTEQLAPSTGSRWSDPGLPRQFESKSGRVARFTWRVS